MRDPYEAPKISNGQSASPQIHDFAPVYLHVNPKTQNNEFNNPIANDVNKPIKNETNANQFPPIVPPLLNPNKGDLLQYSQQDRAKIIISQASPESSDYFFEAPNVTERTTPISPQNEFNNGKYSGVQDYLDKARKALNRGDNNSAQILRQKAIEEAREIRYKDSGNHVAELAGRIVGPVLVAGALAAGASSLGAGLIGTLSIENDEDADISAIVLEGVGRAKMSKPARELKKVREGIGILSSKPARGYVIIPGRLLTPLSKKLGIAAKNVDYKSSELNYLNIRSYESWKASLGSTNGNLHINHLILKDFFNNGPKHLKGLKGYIPSIPMTSKEHLITFHNALNKELRDKNMFKKGKYTQADIEKALLITENYYLKIGKEGNKFAQSWAEACKSFRLNFFDKVKK